jgi:hypothetical protein
MAMPRNRAANWQIGPAQIFISETFIDGTYGPSLYIGDTLDGITFNYKAEWIPMTSDQIGGYNADHMFIGASDCSLEADVLSVDKVNIALLSPTGTLVGPETDPIAVTFGMAPGYRASERTFRVVVRPMAHGTGYGSYDIILYHAFNSGDLELNFKTNEMWKLKVKFEPLVDMSRQPGDWLFRIGEDTGGGGGVILNPISFVIAPQNPVIPITETVSFTANAVLEDFSTADVTTETTWMTSDPLTATISVVGGVAIVTPLLAGTVLISGSYRGFTNNTVVTVTP